MSVGGCVDDSADADGASGRVDAGETGEGGEAGAVDAPDSGPFDDSLASPSVEEPRPPESRCVAEERFAPGQVAAFVETTDAWGLAGVMGTRLSAVDLDGDGWTDLVVRGGAGDYQPDSDDQRLWVLLNRPHPSGQGRTFVDFTEEAGLDRRADGTRGRPLQLLVFGDVDNDGDLDAFTSLEAFSIFAPSAPDPGDRSALLLNDGTGRFSEATPAALSAPFGERAYRASGATFTDLDGDGRIDLFVGYGIGPLGTPDPDHVYLGDGAGGFVEASEALGIVTAPWSDAQAVFDGTAHRRTWAVTACDLNGDGRPDLIGSSYGRAYNSLWLSGAGGYDDASHWSGVSADEDEDWRTNLNAQCFCTLSPDAEDCAGVPAPPSYFPCQPGQTLRWNHAVDRFPHRNAGNSFGAVCGDVNNDGHLDLLTLEIYHWDVGSSSDRSELLIGAGDGRFTRPGNALTGLARSWPSVAFDEGDIHGALFDWDNDGRLDVLLASSDYPGTRAFLYWQQPDGRFEEVSPAPGGLDQHRAQGVAIADFDRDGDLDVILGHSRMRCGADPVCQPTEQVRAFANHRQGRANFTRIRLQGGEGSNRAAIGARVKVVTAAGAQVREVGGGYGINGVQHELVAHFGLGSECAIERLEVRWPDAAASVQVHEGLEANWEILVRQGEPTITYVAAPP